MNKFELVKITLSKAAGRSGLILQKYSPEILTTVGVVGIVVSTVMACKATTKADDVLETAKSDLDKINEVKDMVANKEKNSLGIISYSETDYRKDLAIVYTKSAVSLIKLYAPAVTLGVASVLCIYSASHIMRKRNIALMAAYKAIEQGFANYRNRVIEEFGEKKDYQYRHGIREEEITTIEEDENGKKKKVKNIVEIVDPNSYSQYARWFDEGCSQWKKDPQYNLLFVKNSQRWANDLLIARGHLFLNEVYDMLGFDRTTAGAVVGWVVNGEGDNFVDFGIYDDRHQGTRNFANGFERTILLDFNVNGVVYDKI